MVSVGESRAEARETPPSAGARWKRLLHPGTASSAATLDDESRAALRAGLNIVEADNFVINRVGF
jgi:hypothetical protein